MLKGDCRACASGHRVLPGCGDASSSQCLHYSVLKDHTSSSSIKMAKEHSIFLWDLQPNLSTSEKYLTQLCK